MGDDVEYVNPNRITYIVNGNESKKMPKGEECTDFYMNVDLLYGDKQTIYEFAKCIELANLEILDLCLDVYASGQETAALQQSEDRAIVQLSIEAQHTSLGLFMNEKLMSVAQIDKGFNWIIEPLKEKYNLSDEIGPGLSTSDAQKSSDMFNKTRYLDEITDYKGVIFATGTPISNSITEM